MEKDNILYYAMTDAALLEKLGGYLKETRLQRNKTQQEVADAAGINRSTVIQMENGGGGTLISLIQVLRALEQLHLFSNFEVHRQLSPLQLAKLEQKKRQRAGSKSGSRDESPKSEW